MTSSVGMMTFPTEWKVIKIPWFQSPPTSHALNAKDRDHSPPSTAADAPRRTPSTTDLGATPAALARGSGPRSPPWHRHKVIKSKVLQKFKGPQVISWFITPVTLGLSSINHSYWSYVHQLSYRLGAPLCTGFNVPHEKMFRVGSTLFSKS